MNIRKSFWALYTTAGPAAGSMTDFTFKGDDMRRLYALPLLLAACASPSATALAPITLANGQKVQGIVTVAADRSGAVPAMTMVQSFDVSEPGKTVLLATETAKSAGVSTVLAGSLPGAAPALIASTSRGGDVNINNTSGSIAGALSASFAGALAANIPIDVAVDCDPTTPSSLCPVAQNDQLP